MGSLELALQDAIKATELRPDWPKGYYRKGSALQALQRHEEAFQAFYECLTLEDEKSVNQVWLSWINLKKKTCWFKNS
jgi:stress-induced-phosphoprotein 1